MRNLLYTIFGLLALVLLGSAAVHWEKQALGEARQTIPVQGARALILLIPFAAVSAQEGSGQDTDTDIDEPGETHPKGDDEDQGTIDENNSTDNSVQEPPPVTTTPELTARRHTRHGHKTITVDLSDLVVRPV